MVQVAYLFADQIYTQRYATKWQATIGGQDDVSFHIWWPFERRPAATSIGNGPSAWRSGCLSLWRRLCSLSQEFCLRHTDNTDGRRQFSEGRSI